LKLAKDLWLLITNDDKVAYAEVYRFLYRRFYNYGRKFTADNLLIEDAAQETLINMWDKRHDFAFINYPETYFYTAFRYLLFNKIKQQHKLVFNQQNDEEPEFTTEQSLVENERNEDIKIQLQQSINKLTPRQREAIFLRFYEELSYEEVAQVMKITVKASYKIMAKALSELKENLNLPMGMLIYFLLMK
jgi:RNA polymerase sigma factor (sigma-70 family)